MGNVAREEYGKEMEGGIMLRLEEEEGWGSPVSLISQGGPDEGVGGDTSRPLTPRIDRVT